MIFHIYSNQDLLSTLREELSPLVQHGEQGILSIDVSDLRTKAPLLLSTLQEVIRIRSVGATTRFVQEDIMLNKYLLKKGSLVQVPAAVLHADRASWGGAADTFDPQRFITFQNGDDKINAISCRGFGGGDHICMCRARRCVVIY